jgi:SAM-dependent methyltransferase
MQSSNKTDKDYYTKEFYIENHNSSQPSAEVIVPLILDKIKCNKIVDVGCGDGTWLNVFKRHGVNEILGIDGSYVDENILVIQQENFKAYDLKSPLKLDERFDLALSLEVAEHLPDDCADIFIDSLVNLSHMVLFSAAVPYQGGDNHINEQWQDYWAEKFKNKGYVAIDFIRPMTWNNPNVAYWYQQNTLFFVCSNYLRDNPELRKSLEHYIVKDRGSLSLIHPVFFLFKRGAMTWEGVAKLDLCLPITRTLNPPATKHRTLLYRLKKIINYLLGTN